MKGYMFLLLLVASRVLLAQNPEVQVIVLDNQNLRPIPFATVIFDGQKATISDQSGFFRIRLEQDKIPDSVRISSIGYVTKSFSLEDISLISVDTLYLRPAYQELDEVVIRSKMKRSQTSERILLNAMENLPAVYPQEQLLYRAYYREYLKQEDEYINLFESIVLVEDPGFDKPDLGIPHILYGRLNDHFKRDPFLLKLYDNRDKYVPWAFMPMTEYNDFFILRASDPIRNFRQRSVSFLDIFQTDFIRNHEFSPPSLVYQDDRPYYRITFGDNQNYVYGLTRVRMSGTVFIDAENFGIRKLNYVAHAMNGILTQKLFELTVENMPDQGTYYPHYISHNNLYKRLNFVFKKASHESGQLRITFSREPAPDIALNPDNYKVSLSGFDQKIANIRLDSNQVIIDFARESLFVDRMQKAESGIWFVRTIRRKKAEKYINENLSLEFHNFSDKYGEPLVKNEISTYYQYREYFVKDFSAEFDSIPGVPVEQRLSLAEMESRDPGYQDTAWVNTPLIREDFSPGKVHSSIPLQKHFLEERMKMNAQTSEVVYIHTDREVYAPNDTLWFKAYVRDKALLTPAVMSKTLNICLTDTMGTILSKKKYFITGSSSRGDFFLDPGLPEGDYLIAAWTSWMKNFSLEDLFIRRIRIEHETRSLSKLEIACNKEEYFPGDTLRILVKAYDEMNVEMPGAGFRYSVSSGNEVLDRGGGKTTQNGQENLTIILPDSLKDDVQIFLRSNYNLEDIRVSYTLPVNHKFFVDFFPEGGSYLYGQPTEIAFRATTNEGRPVAVTAEIRDSDGKKISQVGSNVNGMGKFSLKPDADENYFFHLISPGVFSDSYPIPRGKALGWQMHVKPGKNKLELDVIHNFDRPRIALICVSVRGYLNYHKVAGIHKNYHLEIPLNNIPHGVAVVTLFDEEMIPHAERLVFVNHLPEHGVRFQTDYNTYLPRDRVNLNVHIDSKINFRKGSYSLSVFDDYLGSTDVIDEPDIRTSFLFSPEIKGFIHRPDSYFDDFDDDGLERIDLLMLTQGWRRYKLVTMDKKMVPELPAHSEIIGGKLMRPRFGGTMTETSGSLLVYHAGKSVRIEIGEDGRFAFISPQDTVHNQDIFLSARIGENTERVNIELHKTSFETDLEDYLREVADSVGNIQMTDIHTYRSLQDYFSYSLENHQWIEEVVVRKKRIKETFNRIDMVFNKRSATKDQIEAAIDMEHLREMVNVPNPQGYAVFYCIDDMIMDRMDVSLDGVIREPDNSWIEYLDPQDIKEYHVVRGYEAEALYGYGIRYVIDITTVPLEERDQRRVISNTVVLKEYSVPRSFHIPSYLEDAQRYSNIPDLRKTIHWEPELLIDPDGNGMISFYNGDRYTRVRCVLEGITEDGIPVHSEYTYDVGPVKKE